MKLSRYLKVIKSAICKFEEKNRATEIIEDFMIAANGVTVRYLSFRGLPSIRRMVRIPQRWDRIVQIIAENIFKLPKNPNAIKLEVFLAMMNEADPLRFPDLSLAVIKLLGNGEYMAELSEEKAVGYFGLAVGIIPIPPSPNRRYTDLITQRLLKAAIEKRPMPYSLDELDSLAENCTKKRMWPTKWGGRWASQPLRFCLNRELERGLLPWLLEPLRKAHGAGSWIFLWMGC